MQNIPDNPSLVTVGVVGLYPSIPQEVHLRKNRTEGKRIKSLLKILSKWLSLCLRITTLSSTVMLNIKYRVLLLAIKFSPPYACIFMDEIETKFLQTQEFQPLVWVRYIDNVFFIWTHGPDKLVSFMTEFNNYHPNIKFTYESNKENITFLDLDVSLSGNKLTTDLHIKSTDKHQYLHYLSAHPAHTERSIIYSQALRMNRICSYKTDFEKHLVDMKSWFQARGYPSGLIQKEMAKLRAKLYPLERTAVSCKCFGKRCEVCGNVTETSNFTSTATQNTYKINHQFNCSEKCLVYLLTCNKCFKQYVGQTVDEFRRRWNNYKSNDRKFQRLEPCMQEHLFSHFSMAGHDGFLNDVSITFIDKTDPSDPLQREDYWRQTLKAIVPYGLNIEHSV